jgi:hypothetical protein
MFITSRRVLFRLPRAAVLMETARRGIIVLVGLIAAAGMAARAQSANTAQISPVRISVIGESNLRSNFIESLKDAARENKLAIEIVVRNDPSLTFTLIIAQESTVGSAAAAVIALDRQGDVAASVVRSGRMSGRGALNACAKELVKKLLVLAR